jgi:hypothetical protein
MLDGQAGCGLLPGLPAALPQAGLVARPTLLRVSVDCAPVRRGAHLIVDRLAAGEVSILVADA